MRSEREHLAERLEEIAPPGEAGDRERIVAYALRCGSQTMTDDEAFAAARDLLGENGTGPGSEADDVEPKGPFAVTLDDFVDTEREHAEALIGSEDDCILPAYALGMLIARGGKGKTTWSIDFTCHAASAVEFCGLEIPRSLNILLIENEGPEAPFARKLARKRETWEHEITGNIYICTDRWGFARVDDPEFVAHLNAFCEEHEVDLVIGDPLDSLGMTGEGKPSETREMVDRFKEVGLFASRAWLVPHHSRKESVQDAVDEASGAWGGRPDAMLTIEKQPGNTARLGFAKVRWQARERNPYILDFDPETESFTFDKEEEDEERDYRVETEEFLRDKAPQIVADIAKGIRASKPKVQEALDAHPDTFDLITGDAAKAIKRRADARLYTLVKSRSDPSDPMFPLSD